MLGYFYHLSINFKNKIIGFVISCLSCIYWRIDIGSGGLCVKGTVNRQVIRQIINKNATGQCFIRNVSINVIKKS